MRVQVVNWKKYMGRGDINHPRWFAFQKELFLEPRYIGKVTPDVVTAFCYVCCMALGTKDGVAEVEFAHLQAYTGLTRDKFTIAMEELLLLQLVHDFVRGPNGSERDRHAVLKGREGKGTEPQDTADGTSASTTTYEFFDQPKKKREKKPKPKLPCDPIPAFKEIEEILREREVTTILQQKWEKTYQLAAVVAAVRKADSWLVSSGEQKKNYGQYFNNWLMRDAEKNPRILRAPAQPAQSELPASAPSGRKKTWWEQQQDEADRKAAQGGAQ